jgi:hypothetical protein
MSEVNTLTLDAPELSIADYRTFRENAHNGHNPSGALLRGGETVAKPVAAPESSTADEVAGTAAVTEEAETIEEPKEPKEPKDAKKDKLSVRFSELTAKIRTLESELAAKSGAGREEAKPAAPATDSNDPEPDPNKYTDYTEYQKALIKWEVKQEKKAEVAQAADAAKRAEAQKAANAWSTRVAEASETFEDFESVALNPELTVTAVMADAIKDSEAGPEVLYHLGQNPAEAARIAKLSPLAQVRELGKLEAVLTARATKGTADETPQTKKPVVSKAPAPVRPLGGAAAASSSAKAIESMSMSEYRALRESGKIR